MKKVEYYQCEWCCYIGLEQKVREHEKKCAAKRFPGWLEKAKTCFTCSRLYFIGGKHRPKQNVCSFQHSVEETIKYEECKDYELDIEWAQKTHIENKLLHDTKNYSALRLMALDKLNKGIIDVPSLEEIYINATSCPEGNEGPKVPVWIAEKCLLIEIYKGICNIERLLNLLITNRDNDRGKRNSNSEN